jgi:hypothetical protein
MQPLRDGLHDHALHEQPVVDHLLIPHADHVVPPRRQNRVMRDVARPLFAHVVAAVDLDHQAIADQHVDAMARDPRLRHDPQIQPAEPIGEDRLETRVAERLGLSQ